MTRRLIVTATFNPRRVVFPVIVDDSASYADVSDFITHLAFEYVVRNVTISTKEMVEVPDPEFDEEPESKVVDATDYL